MYSSIILYALIATVTVAACVGIIAMRFHAQKEWQSTFGYIMRRKVNNHWEYRPMTDAEKAEWDDMHKW